LLPFEENGNLGDETTEIAEKFSVFSQGILLKYISKRVFSCAPEVASPYRFFKFLMID